MSDFPCVLRARVCLSRGATARILCQSLEWDALTRGVLSAAGEIPVTGDWVHVRPLAPGQALIEDIEPRTSWISRRAAGRTAREQVLAANVDLALLVAGLDGDLNVRRLERYLAMARAGHGRPVVVLNKADLRPPPPLPLPAVEVLAVSARTGEGFEGLEALLVAGQTAVLLGSSGAGKSSIINRLLGAEQQPTSPVRTHDSRGRHTTSDRELVTLRTGAEVIDTPGLREIQLLASGEALDLVFDEIARLALRCRFADCQHRSEPGCAVRDAVDPLRLESLRKLQQETARNGNARAEKQRWRNASKAMKRHYREREKW